MPQRLVCTGPWGGDLSQQLPWVNAPEAQGESAPVRPTVDRPQLVAPDTIWLRTNGAPTPSRAVTAERRLTSLAPAPAALSRSKRFVDIVGSAFGLMVCSPIIGSTWLVVRLTSPGPGLYRQERIGLCGKPFTMLKFRTMADGADEQLVELLTENDRHLSPLFKVPNDPRITKVGRWLRRASLDELPQLVNVFRGEMSLVGPRPQRLAEVVLYEHDQFDRLSVRPGITGVWQTSGRSDLPWEEAVLLDLQYVRTWTRLTDSLILGRTVWAVLSGQGAH